MNPLLKIRPWLNFRESLSEINDSFPNGWKISATDILHAAAAGHITLSIFFSQHPTQREIFANGKVVSEDLVSESVMDIDVRDKETRYWLEKRAEDWKKPSYEFLRLTHDNKLYEAVDTDFGFDDVKYKPIRGLPDDGEIVIRTENLLKFIDSFNTDVKVEKLDGRLKNNLLKCISVLCDAHGIVIGKQGEAQKLVALVERAGWSISDETVNGYFDMIRELKN